MQSQIFERMSWGTTEKQQWIHYDTVRHFEMTKQKDQVYCYSSKLNIGSRRFSSSTACPHTAVRGACHPVSLCMWCVHVCTRECKCVWEGFRGERKEGQCARDHTVVFHIAHIVRMRLAARLHARTPLLVALTILSVCAGVRARVGGRRER